MAKSVSELLREAAAALEHGNNQPDHVSYDVRLRLDHNRR